MWPVNDSWRADQTENCDFRSCSLGVTSRRRGVATPAYQQDYRDDDQRQGQADPHAVDAPVEEEAGGNAEGQAEEPVADEVGPHGDAGFSEAAESAGADGLDAVEDLEDGGDPEQAGADGEDARVAGVKLDQRSGRDEEYDAGEDHESGAECECEPAGAAGACLVSGADGVTDADGGCGGDAERDHVGDAGVVDGDLVGGEGDGVEPAGGERGGVPGADFEGDLRSGGRADSFMSWRMRTVCTPARVAEERMAACWRS